MGRVTGPYPYLHACGAGPYPSASPHHLRTLHRLVVSNLSASSTGSMALCRQKLSGIASQCVNFWRQMGTVADKRNIEDHKRRLLAAKYEVKRKLYKALHRDVDLPNELREKFLCKLAQLPRNSSFTRVRNRCIFSGRPRAVYEKFRMSRIVFRSLASQAATTPFSALYKELTMYARYKTPEDDHVRLFNDVEFFSVPELFPVQSRAHFSSLAVTYEKEAHLCQNQCETASHDPWGMFIIVFSNQPLETSDVLVTPSSFAHLHFVTLCEDKIHRYLNTVD
ncbi:hypothetical protein QYF36_010857 [Acer negundo]|nr:hypothetical protein QYF36_010857 [Acer negundo]